MYQIVFKLAVIIMIVMDRRNFMGLMAGGSVYANLSGTWKLANKNYKTETPGKSGLPNNLRANLVICGASLGGCAAALAALRNHLTVIMTEETDWPGGQLTSQGVPPDEHQWIETHGATKLYREFRDQIRNYYRKSYPLTESAKAVQFLNPGNGAVSRLCHEPRAALAVLYEMFAPWLSSGKLIFIPNTKISGAEVEKDKVISVSAKVIDCNHEINLSAPYFMDATELGDLLPITGTEFVEGTESRNETGELHAPEVANPANQQAFTVCFAMDYRPGEDHTIDKPAQYDFWRDFVPKLAPPWPGRLLDLVYTHPPTLKPRELGFNPEGVTEGSKFNLWNYRRIIDKNNFKEGFYSGDITVVNWPQNDYMLGNLTGISDEEFRKHVEAAKQLSLSLLYWLQTEVPRPGKGYGWPGLRLRPDIMGTCDGLAKYPYVRESRRIKAMFTVFEEHVGKQNRAMVTGREDNRAMEFPDSIGTGYYHIDLHPSSGGDNYIDFESLPFQIPLGSLIPVRMQNLIPACKNIGTTHITNGCYRLHPVEWNIGESAGVLIAFSLQKKVQPRQVYEKHQLLEEFQKLLISQGIELKWPEV